MDSGLKIASRWLTSGLELLASTVGVAAGCCLDVDLDKHPGVFLGSAVEFVQDAPTVTFLSLALFVAIMRVVRWLLPLENAHRERLEGLISSALTEFQSQVFPDLDHSLEVHRHRVTLFRHHNFCWHPQPYRHLLWPWGVGRWPGSGWLRICSRSGHVTVRSRTCFLAPDDGNSEGVAGLAWNRKTYIVKTAIDLNKEKYIPSIYRLYYRLHLAFRSWHHVGARRYRQLRNKVGVYAKATNISEKLVWKRLKSGKTMPTSMTALILHDKSGTAKAVLVIDSCSAQVCLEPTDDKFRKHLKALREKLEAFGAYHD